MGGNLFWLSDEQWRRIEPHLPTDVRGVGGAADRKIVSGIVHVLKCGSRWCDCPPEYGSSTTIYNRFVRWAEHGIWENLFRALGGPGREIGMQMIDFPPISKHIVRLRSKGENRRRRLAARATGETRRFTHSQMLKGAFLPCC